MALVNPNIAMSFRQPEFRPRNALAEYAQVQQIVGGQRQAEIADVQLEDLRRERGILGQIAAAISAKGGPDLRTASLLMMQNPRTSEQGYNIYQALQKQQRLDEYERQFGGGAGAPTTPTSATGAITGAAPAAAEPVKSTDFDMRSHVEEKGTPESPFIEVMPYASSPTSTQLRAQGKSQAELRGMLQSESESGRPLVRYVNPMDSASGRVFSYSMPTSTNPFLAEPLPPFEPTNALAPSEPAPANAMLAAQPATPPAGVNQLAAAGGAAAAAAAPLADPTAALRAKRDQLIALGTPRALQAAKSLDADIALMSKRITASPGSVVYDASGKVIATAPAAPITPRVEIIGVAKGTDTPVYVDKNTDEQFKIGVDASGKQVRVPYTGAVNRATSTVTAPVDVRVNAFVPASETAQAEYMKGARTTFEALRNAQPTLDNIEKAKALVPGAKGFMGTGGEPLLAAASFLNNRLGTSINTTGVTDAQELRSRLFFGILDNLKKLDSQPSQQQQMALQQALGSIGTDPTALPRVLDAFGDSIRTKVDLYNADVTSAEDRGVKFPYKPQIQLKPRAPLPGESAAQTPGAAPAAGRGGNLSPAEQAELDQLRSRFGGGRQ